MRRVWIALLIGSFGWGTAGVATRLVLDDGVEPFTVATLRAAIAALVVIGFLVVRRTPFPRGIALRVGVVMGVTSVAVPYLTSNVALQHASAGFVGVTTALIPLLTAVLAHFFLVGERLSAFRLVGLLAGFVGVTLLMISGDSGLADGGQPVLAGVLSLIGVVSIAVGSVYAKRHAGGYDPFEVVGVQFVSGTAIMVVATVLTEGALPLSLGGGSWALLVYMGVVSTFVPFALYYWMLRRASATFASMAGYLVPPIAVVSGIVFLSERLEKGIILGGLVILAGVILGDRAERRSGGVERAGASGPMSPPGSPTGS
ncbi:MAG TPA: DMT family transporter [Acidimicrobiia bacterium]|nr:DMT family transporter [Acidimicrobiia bacterium]